MHDSHFEIGYDDLPVMIKSDLKFVGVVANKNSH